MLAPLYAAEYAVGRATGAWAGAGEFGVRAGMDPRLTQLPARALMALLGALAAGVVVLAARATGLPTGAGAWAAGWLLATALLHVQFSTQERPWVAVVFFGALCLWAAAVHERSGGLRSLLLAGAAGGLAFGCHQAGLVFLGLCGLAWAFAPDGWRGAALRRRLLAGTACVAVFAVVNLVLGQPYYLVHGAVEQQAVVGGDQAAGLLSFGGQAVRLGVSLDSLRRLSRVLAGYDPALVVLGLLGLAVLLRRRGGRAAGAFALVTAAFFGTNPSDHVRYLLPTYLPLALAGGLAVERLLRSRAGTVVAALVLVVPLVQALRLGLVLERTDTRALAETRLATLPDGARVAIDHYGPQVDLSLAALERVGELRGELRTRERMRYELLSAGVLSEAERGVDAVPVEELFQVDEAGDYVVRPGVQSLGETPAQVLAALGVTHLLLVERRPRAPEPRPLAHLAEGREALWTLSPAPGGGAPAEAFLPTEMDFPLTGLWTVERPGPWMQLVRLADPPGG
jgi:hypothetical protein